MPHYGVLIKYAVPWMLSRAHLRKHRSRKTKVMMAFALFRKSQLMGGNLVIIINTYMMHQFTGKKMVTGFSNLESPLKVCILSHRIIKLPSRWSFSYWSWVGGWRLQSAPASHTLCMLCVPSVLLLVRMLSLPLSRWKSWDKAVKWLDWSQILVNSTPIVCTVLCAWQAGSHLILPLTGSAFMRVNLSKVQQLLCDKERTVSTAHVLPTATGYLPSSQGTPFLSSQRVAEGVVVGRVWNGWFRTEAKRMGKEKKFTS